MAVDKLSILDNIETTLLAITAGATYRTTVDTVERQIKVWSEVGAQERVWVGFAPTETRNLQQGDAHEYMCAMTVKVVSHVNAATPAACTTALCNLEDDIIGALCDPARQYRGSDSSGNNAVTTTWLRTAEDIGDPAAIDSTGGYGTHEMDFEIRFVRPFGVTPQ